MFLAHSWSIFPIFGQKFFSPENPALSRKTSIGFLTLCKNLEKTNNTLPRKYPDRQKDGQSIFYRTLPPTTRRPKI